MRYLLPALLLILTSSLFAAEYSDQRQKALQLYQDGNYAEAYDIFREITLAPDNTSARISSDLQMAINCLNNLNRVTETDAFIEQAIDAQAENWRLLQAAAQQYTNLQHWGFMIAGEFERGQHRGGGDVMNSTERDRTRALQLIEQAIPLVEQATPSEQSSFYLTAAQLVLFQRHHNQGSWRLQVLTDLSELPDYDPGYGHHYGGQTQGAPVDENGDPIFYYVPKGFDQAANDGERWRWLLVMAMEAQASVRDQVMNQQAQFFHQQFGVHTLQQFSGYFWGAPREPDDTGDTQAAIFSLHTLKDNETIARLATGVKRFELPDEFNYIRIWQQLDDGRGNGQSACQRLGQIYENRQQYPKAAEQWRRMIEVYNRSNYQQRLDQIIDNWGTFEPHQVKPAGQPATFQYRFRNGEEVRFVAHEILVDDLIRDVKAYLKSNPTQIDWRTVNLEQIGYRIVQENEQRYLGEKVADWDLALDPRPHHFDRRIVVESPLKKAGAYLVKAEMEDGNTSRIIVWLADTAIAHKRLDNANYYFIADAVNGQAIPKANVEFFGYRTEGVDSKLRRALGRRINVITEQFAEYTDQDGQIILGPDRLPRNHNWLVIARTDEGRLAYLGFQGVWYGGHHDAAYNQTKTFAITDRPVYRPGQNVKFKLWMRRAQYDKEYDSAFAGNSINVRIWNPKNEKIYEKQLKADAYGGVNDEFPLPGDATLGVYRIQTNYGGQQGNFRVEEYKKPEFEVTVDAPSKPIELGDKIEAKVKANYYFGAPVVNARVKVKVLRDKHDTTWYPSGPWDWFYGSGYWWFAYDYTWYPGWRFWGCERPIGWWWNRPSPPPELVTEAEMEIGADGTVSVPIDTALAKAIHGDSDHRYRITAEVTDESRRTIVGTGSVIAAREPYRVYVWLDRGYYNAGDTIEAGFSARTPDGRPVSGNGQLVLYRITYNDAMEPQENAVEEWSIELGDTGRGDQQMTAAKPGQYRLSLTLTDSEGHEQEGGYIFTVRDARFDGESYRFNAVELIPDKKHYEPGDEVKLAINVNQADATVLLFVRPTNGIYLKPRVLKMKGKSRVETIAIAKKDMPNFFVEALTIANGDVHTTVREIIVPPEKRVLNVEVLPNEEAYKPGSEAKVRLRLTDFYGEPFIGSTVISVYDKAVEYISGGSNVPEIRDFFWKWRRNHNPSTTHNLERYFHLLLERGERGMSSIGAFGNQVANMPDAQVVGRGRQARMMQKGDVATFAMDAVAAPSAARAPAMEAELAEGASMADSVDGGAGGGETEMAEATVRTEFADTAFWNASLQTDQHGIAEFSFDMPENLTTWKIKTWAMGHGTKVGEGVAEVVTTKNLILRLQAPRFFVEKDEVVLSANIHNYLSEAKDVRAVLEMEGGTLELMEGYDATRTITVEANGEQRVDWRVKVTREGEAIIRMKALTNEESDAMQMSFPVKVHGIMKTVSFSGHIPQDENGATLDYSVPPERRVDESRLEIRYSPTLAGAMVDALPYLLEYPYGCTEQTLNRFVPAVITQKILLDMGLDLQAIKEKQTNLNAQEIGDDKARAAQWQKERNWTHDADGNRIPFNPVFDQDEMQRIVKKGVQRLTNMQLSDGGWGWFSGYGEHSYPHTTAVVVHGLQLARQNDVAIVPGVIESGVQWLKQYQDEQLRLLERGEEKDPKWPYKSHADHLDAFVYMVLVDARMDNEAMREHLYKDRTHLAVYAKSMLGIALHRVGDMEKRDMIIRNIEQFLVKDPENQTAYLNLGNNGYWWYWYGSEYEAHAYYLKLLAETDPKGETAPWLVKYLLNNRKHATYWKSTRDTAIVIEAFADYMRASGEDNPDMTVQVLIDGRQVKEVEITPQNLFTFDNQVLLTGDDLTSGEHTVEFKKTGDGPLYFNAYLSYFSLEDYITKAGLEIKVTRDYYKLVPVEKTIDVAGSHGQAVNQRVEKYERQKLDNLDTLTSGDMVEIELVIESKNDYEYIIFEDLKPAGFETVDVQSGYTRNGLGAYMELRDDRVSFFVRALARGRHSINYRMRAEIPGKFSALPTKAYAMYAPELKGNSDEIKLNVED